MTDFSAQIRAGLLATQPNRESFARNCVAEFDRNGDGTIGAGEFLKVFASLQRTDEMAGSGQTSYVSAGIRPTVFDCTLFPAFSRSYAISAYHAQTMLDSFDRDGDQSVTLDELLHVGSTSPSNTVVEDEGVSPAPNEAEPEGGVPVAEPSAEQRADDLLSLYDKQAKGFIDISDIISAWVSDPSLGDISQAGSVISAWDRDGDERVTRDELVAGFGNLDTANALMAALSDPASGVIKLASLTEEQLAQTDLTRSELSVWDSDHDGVISRTEILNALRKASVKTDATPEEIAQALVTRFDADQSTMLSEDEFTRVLETYQIEASQAQDSFNAWDLDRDGAISSSELAAGIRTIQDAKMQVAAFDSDHKGYFTLEDLQRVMASESSTATASAEDLMLWWDVDGDGMVTPQDVIARKNLDAVQAGSSA